MLFVDGQGKPLLGPRSSRWFTGGRGGEGGEVGPRLSKRIAFL